MKGYTNRSDYLLKITSVSVVIVIILSCRCLATTLNKDFNLKIWNDNSLWDDDARFTASRLGLSGTGGRDNNETFRATVAGRITSLGLPLYAIDLYPKNGKVSRIILGFINEADLYKSNPGDFHQFSKKKDEAFDQGRIYLTKRLGRPSGEGNSLHWSWLNHTLTLKNTDKALLLDITPGKYIPNANARQSVIADKQRTLTPPQRYVKREQNGDVYISGIPKISQGSRGYCVPATWEKVLRHNGLGFNVYDLAEEGSTSVNGSYFTLFTSRVKGMLKPHQYKVEHLRFTPDNIKMVASYINKGYPLIWHMDAQDLRRWVSRNRQRRGKLPDDSANTSLNPSRLAGHALLIIGYNSREQEIALSDSTELGSSETVIWIHASEARAAHQSRTELLAVIPPGRTGGKDFLKAKWY
ncbi:MAG: C39 family peptidase [Verrucomicrobiota bacterium]